MKKLALLLIVCAGTLFSCAKKEEDTLPMKVAKAYGFENFDKLNSIAYTWHVQVDSATVRSRHWKWDIKDRMVTFTDTDTSYSYSQDLPADALPPADKGFINDKYWLMYPFQLAWDTGYTYEVSENATAPIGGQTSTKLTIVYNSSDGYTPGDAYDLYLDDQHMILEWVFRRGNGNEGRAFTWETVKDFTGIKLATEHRNDQGAMFIWFTDLEVK